MKLHFLSFVPKKPKNDDKISLTKTDSFVEFSSSGWKQEEIKNCILILEI